MTTVARRLNIYQRQYFKYDIMSALVVFLVAIPLCLGIALASGAPIFSGIITGVVGGLVVGALSQSSVSVSGPAAGMVTVVLATISQLGGFHLFLAALVCAGVFQILFGIIRGGFLADYIPSSVIQGLLCAIGILIIVKQLPMALTHPEQYQLLLQSLDVSELNWAPIKNIWQHIDLGAFIIAAISFCVLIFFDKTQNPKLKIIPAPVLVVALGVLINEIYPYLHFALQQDSDQLVNIPLTNGKNIFLAQLQFPDWKGFLDHKVYAYGLYIAALASLETLLNLEAAEKLDKRHRYCSRNRELIAQGVGNTICGFLGGIPITSVIVRTSVNIQAGAKTKFSTILHGLYIFLAVSFFPLLLNKIPLASLAAILIFVGYKLSKVSIYTNMYKQGLERFAPFIVTVIAIVFTNLLMGIAIGLFVSFFFILKSNSQIRFDIIQEMHPAGIVKRLVLPQQVSFLKKAGLVAELSSIPIHTNLIIDAHYSKFIDKDILELIREFKDNQAPERKIALNLVGFKEKYDVHDHIDFINVTTFDIQAALTPPQVLKILQEGNQRFMNDQRIHRNVLSDIKATSATQHPMAVVLACIDSRVPVETIFDMGLGDLFCVRIAGNVVNDDILASIEFACASGAKLVLVLGHTRCGAINAACKGDGAGHLTGLLNKIKPAIEAERAAANHEESSDAFLFNVTSLNVKNTLRALEQESPLISKLVAQNAVALTGAIYDVQCGKVIFD